MLSSKKVLVALLLFICFSVNHALAGNYEFNMEKEYISPDQVFVSEDGIFVIENGELSPVCGIMQDSEGLYSLKLPLGYWKCRNGHPNPPWNATCAVPGCRG